MCLTRKMIKIHISSEGHLLHKFQPILTVGASAKVQPLEPIGTSSVMRVGHDLVISTKEGSEVQHACIIFYINVGRTKR